MMGKDGMIPPLNQPTGWREEASRSRGHLCELAIHLFISTSCVSCQDTSSQAGQASGQSRAEYSAAQSGKQSCESTEETLVHANAQPHDPGLTS